MECWILKKTLFAVWILNFFLIKLLNLFECRKEAFSHEKSTKNSFLLIKRLIASLNMRLWGFDCAAFDARFSSTYGSCGRWMSLLTLTICQAHLISLALHSLSLSFLIACSLIAKQMPPAFPGHNSKIRCTHSYPSVVLLANCIDMRSYYIYVYYKCLLFLVVALMSLLFVHIEMMTSKTTTLCGIKFHLYGSFVFELLPNCRWHIINKIKWNI